jgi:hypothetical protein
VTSVERGFRLGMLSIFRRLNVVLLRVLRKTRTKARLESSEVVVLGGKTGEFVVCQLDTHRGADTHRANTPRTTMVATNFR